MRPGNSAAAKNRQPPRNRQQHAESLTSKRSFTRSPTCAEPIVHPQSRDVDGTRHETMHIRRKYHGDVREVIAGVEAFAGWRGYVRSLLLAGAGRGAHARSLGNQPPGEDCPFPEGSARGSRRAS